MFTGIIKNIGIIQELDLEKNFFIKIKSNFKNKIEIGESICCSGVCLTVRKVVKSSFWVDISKETMNKTNIKNYKVGLKLNLEKSLRVGDELGGHLVFGHVDGISKIKSILTLKDSHVLTLEVEDSILKYLISKCSITLDGISLTVNEVKKKEIKLSIIPFTWDNTTLQNISVGSEINTEIDMLARYTFKALERLKI